MRKANVAWILGIASVTALTPALAGPRVDRTEKGNAIELRLVSDAQVAGYDKVAYGSGTVYAAPHTLLTGADVTAVDSQPARGGANLVLGVSDQAASDLAALSSKDKTVSIGVYIDGRLNTVGTLSGVSNQPGAGSATISGLTSAQAERLVKLVNSGITPAPAGAVIQVVPTGQSGNTYFVDIFIDGAKGLRSYQVTLDTNGGSAGSLTRTDVVINKTRPDYVFGTEQTIVAEDKAGGRAGAVLFDGSVDVAKGGYLGTYAFEASADARGSFAVNVQVGPNTILGDARNRDLDYSAGADAVINIGQTPNPRLGR